MNSFVIISFSVRLSAFLSGMEIAYLSSNKLRLELDKQSNSIVSRLLQRILHSPSKYIATMLVGNNISLSSDGLVVAFRKGSDVEVYEKINENLVQRGDTINLDDNFWNFNLSVDGNKLIIRNRENNTDNFKIIIYYLTFAK